MKGQVMNWLRIIGFLFVVGAVSLNSVAGDGTWSVPAGGVWSDSTNWQDGAVAGDAGAAAYFRNEPGPSVLRPLVMIDTNVLLNKIENWLGSTSTMYFVAEQIPDTMNYYQIDAGADDFSSATSRTINWKVSLAGSGVVRLSGGGFFEFRKDQPFTGPLLVLKRSSYKGISYQSFADSTNTVTSDLLATEEVRINWSTLRVSGRFPRRASTGRQWELLPGASKVRVVDVSSNLETLYSPGQVVTGDHIPEGTFITFFQDDATLCLSQPLLDDFSATVTQTLSFAAAPCWDVVQRIDQLVSASDEMAGVGGLQFRPHIASGYGTNSVTLRVNKLTGTNPLLVSVDSSQGGSDGRLGVNQAEAFQQLVTLKDTAALELGDQASVPASPASVPAFWVDASDVASLTKDSVGNVTHWADTRGNAYPSAASWVNTPEYVTNALNGLAVVDFGALGSNRGLAWDREITGIKAVFWVIGSQASGGTLLGSKPGHTTNYRRGFDCLRAIANTAANYVIGLECGLVGYNTPIGDYVAINGREALLSGSGLSGDYDLVVASVPSQSYKASAFAFDDYDAAGTRFSGGQRLAEVIVYTNTLTTTQIKDTEAYLYKKWFGRETLGYGAGKIDLLETSAGANARIGQAGTEPVEARYVKHGGALTVMADSTVTLKADANLSKLSLEDGAHVVLKARKIPPAPLLANNILWLDAAREEDFTLAAGNEVASWRNRGGGSVQTVVPGTVKPSRVQNDTGRWLVDLGERDNGCCLMTISNLMTRSAFVVWFSRADGTMPLGSLKGGYAGHNEFRPWDFNRTGVATMLSISGNLSQTALGGQWFLDGLPIQPTATIIPTNQLMMTSAVMQGWGGRVSALGGYDFDNTPTTYPHSGGMQLAEVLLYDRSLDEDERRDVEAYLSRKWFGTLLPGYADDNGAISLAEVAVNGSAELEVQGNTRVRIESLSGAGTLTTSGAVIADMITNPHKLSLIQPPTTGGVRVTRATASPAPDMPATGAAMWFDAALPSSISLYSTTYAQYWEDRISGVKAESAFGVASWVPIYKPNSANGLPVIDFEQRGRKRAYKWSPRLTGIRTVFMMFKDKGPTQGGGWLLGDTTKVSDFARGSWGTHFGNSALFEVNVAAAAVTGGEMFLDGVPCSAAMVPKWNYQVITLTTTDDTSADMIAGDRTKDHNWSGLEVGEVILYTRVLSRAECEATEDYLMNKWLARRSPRAVCVDTQRVVEAYGTVPLYVTELDGVAGEITAIRGYGDVVIDNADVTILSDAATFEGRVILRNNSKVTLDAGLFAASEWIVEEGSVLDLGGQTVTLAGIGGNGCVSNGTLVVTHVTPNLPELPGMLTVKGDLVLTDGALFTVHYVPPSANTLQVTGRVTVEGTGVVLLERPIGLNFSLNVPLIRYGSIAGVENLLTTWTFDGDYASTYMFRLEHDSVKRIVWYKGFARGTTILIR